MWDVNPHFAFEIWDFVFRAPSTRHPTTAATRGARETDECNRSTVVGETSTEFGIRNLDFWSLKLRRRLKRLISVTTFISFLRPKMMYAKICRKDFRVFLLLGHLTSLVCLLLFFFHFFKAVLIWGTFKEVGGLTVQWSLLGWFPQRLSYP